MSRVWGIILPEHYESVAGHGCQGGRATANSGGAAAVWCGVV
jgi:hypothetical protein